MSEVAEKLWYRNTRTGDLGYLVEEGEGKCHIHLDRFSDDAIRPFTPGLWEPEEVRKPLTRYQCAWIAFETDKLLCRMIGKPTESKKEWLNLTDAARTQFAASGPDDGGIRDFLFDAIMQSLEEFSSG